MIIATNKKAYFNYEILETFEAGIILTGPEVKSAKYGKINLTGGYVSINNQGALELINVHISPYPPAFNVQQNYNPTHTRKLLIKKKEIRTLIGKMKVKGVTLIPLKVYTKGGLVKIECGLARGKKQWDKREAIKERDYKRREQKDLDPVD
ncbi:MAG: SsrA-binding protein SmpB [Patescibacteria group bacterium]